MISRVSPFRSFATLVTLLLSLLTQSATAQSTTTPPTTTPSTPLGTNAASITPTDGASGNDYEDDGSLNLSHFYYILVIVFILIGFVAFWFFVRRRRYHRNGGVGGTVYAVNGPAGRLHYGYGPAPTAGLQGAYSTAARRRFMRTFGLEPRAEEGLDERGEAPPPYVPGQPAPPADAAHPHPLHSHHSSDANGQPIAMHDLTGKPPDYDAAPLSPSTMSHHGHDRDRELNGEEDELDMRRPPPAHSPQTPSFAQETMRQRGQERIRAGHEPAPVSELSGSPPEIRRDVGNTEGVADVH
ncbi:hypothetical protein MMC25_001381 [Agyrium rufum]|nr:hypothetical protein [Agyrium rufum]